MDDFENYMKKAIAAHQTTRQADQQFIAKLGEEPSKTQQELARTQAENRRLNEKLRGLRAQLEEHTGSMPAIDLNSMPDERVLEQTVFTPNFLNDQPGRTSELKDSLVSFQE